MNILNRLRAARRQSKPYRVLLCIALGAAMALTGAASFADTESAAGDATRSKILLVDKLMHESSAARKVSRSGNEQAKTLRTEAEVHFESARRHSAEGDLDAAQRDIELAVQTFQAAVHAATVEASVSAKDAGDYARRRDSVEALTNAHERVSKEKNVADRHAELAASVTAGLKTSDRLLEEGKAPQAKAALDDIYESVIIAVESLREGDTLIRELRFETSEDEYVYELDRNDTHNMLLRVLVDEKLRQSGMRTTTQSFVDRATELRKQAEDSAARDEFDDATELLEQSTAQLIRAIRSTGVYIPG